MIELCSYISLYESDGLSVSYGHTLYLFSINQGLYYGHSEPFAAYYMVRVLHIVENRIVTYNHLFRLKMLRKKVVK